MKRESDEYSSKKSLYHTAPVTIDRIDGSALDEVRLLYTEIQEEEQWSCGTKNIKEDQEVDGI